MKNTAILLIHCPDQMGIVAATSELLYRHRANILHSDQHVDPERDRFLMRIEWDLEGFALSPEEFRREFRAIADRFRMQWHLALSRERARVAILVSKVDHCLVDLLHRHQSGELACEIPLILSNHPDNLRTAEFYGVPFHERAVTSETKGAAEVEQLALLEDRGVDLIVLARYMQILSPAFVARYPERIINIHHSFLPAFVGARPYHQAFARGVKLIGATSHFVTESLDEGPIIEQDVSRVSHRDTVEELVQKGRDLEKVVLSRAVRWWLDHRILAYDNRTVVFD